MAMTAVVRRLTLLDRAIVTGLLILAAVLFPLLGRGGTGDRVIVERDGSILFTAPLAEDRTVPLPGPLGETVLAIRRGEARILSSPCRHHVCLGMGGIRERGHLIACLPNRLLVRIDGDGKGAKDYDLLSR
jgi:hypothetical protein